METLKLIFSDYTFQIVSIGSALLGFSSGIVGSFAVLRKQSLLGDAVSHAALPGIAIAFLLMQVKNTEILLLGALLTGLLATFSVNYITKNSRIKYDSVLALVLTVFFGAGLVLLTYIQKIPNSNQAGLDNFIFGQASALLKKDIQIILIVGIVMMLVVALFWKELKLLSFDSEFSQSIGFSNKKINLILSSLIVTSIIVGLQTVGVILMSAMLVAPGVAARQWTDKLSIMVILAGIFGAFSGLVGTIISSLYSNIPTGPSIVIIVSTIVLISITFAPNRGLVWKQIREIKNRKDINEDKILISLYELAINHQEKFHSHHISLIKPIKTKAGKKTNRLRTILIKLKSKGLANEDYFDTWSITKKGFKYIENHPNRKEE